MARKQNPINDIVDTVGAWFGGNRGTVQSTGSGTVQRVDAQSFNQTRFVNGKPQYPEPQSLRNMPFQNAGYDDKFNKRGQRASTQNIQENIVPGYERSAEVFVRDIGTVYVNPAYMSEYIDPPGTADRKEAKAKKFEGLTKQLSSFAEANSKYFDKNFEVLPYPKRGNPTMYGKKQVDPQKTLQLNIQTGRKPENPNAVAWASTHPLSMPVPGKGIKFQQESPRQKDIVFSVEHNDFSRLSPYTPSTLQHEFHHSVGLEHSKNYNAPHKEQDKNTITSYAKETELENSSQMLPSDVNFWKQVQNTVDVKRRAKNAYKGVAKKRK